MMFYNAILLLTLLSSAVYARPLETDDALTGSPVEDGNIPMDHTIASNQFSPSTRLFKRADVALQQDSNVYTLFSYRGVNSTATDQYVFRTQVTTRLTVLDFLCSGDAFDVYNGDNFIGGTPSINNTAAIQNCTDFAARPEDAIGRPNVFSQAVFILPPGSYRIRIVARESPFGVGTGALRLDTQRPTQCTLSDVNDIILVSTGTGVNQTDAPSACLAANRQLANLSADQILNATRLMTLCLGTFQQAWIGAYNGDTYGDSCLSLYVGAMASSPGSVIVSAECSTLRPVLCQ